MGLVRNNNMIRWFCILIHCLIMETSNIGRLYLMGFSDLDLYVKCVSEKWIFEGHAEFGLHIGQIFTFYRCLHPRYTMTHIWNARTLTKGDLNLTSKKSRTWLIKLRFVCWKARSLLKGVENDYYQIKPNRYFSVLY